jgi:ParB family chromosome partitioning protein
MAKKRGLGRGLDALLGASQASSPAEADTTENTQVATTAQLAIDLIQRGRYQPRRHFDEDKLRELADSIGAQGMVQPIVVRKIEGDKYEIIAGERRWRAAQLTGLADVPVVIKDVDDQTAMAMALVENIQRDDLNPLEEATALHRLLEEFALTHQQIAQAVGKSRTMVSNLLRLLELTAEAKSLLEQGQIEMGHARALLALKGDAQSRAAAEVARKGLSVRATEALVRQLSAENRANKTKPQAEDPNVRSLLEDLGSRLGARVALQQGTGGKGKLVISYNSLDELEGILSHIK